MPVRLTGLSHNFVSTRISHKLCLVTSSAYQCWGSAPHIRVRWRNTCLPSTADLYTFCIAFIVIILNVFIFIIESGYDAANETVYDGHLDLKVTLGTYQAIDQRDECGCCPNLFFSIVHGNIAIVAITCFFTSAHITARVSQPTGDLMRCSAPRSKCLIPV